MHATDLLPLLLGVVAVAAIVTAVVLALAVSHGTSLVAQGPTYGLSRDVVVVNGTAQSSSGVEAGLPASSLSSSDADALANPGFVPDAESVAPTMGLRTQVDAFGRTVQTDVIGSTDALARVQGYSVAQGRFITAADVRAGAPVIVLGQSVVTSLFAGADPIGQGVQINGQNFQVVGTLTERGYSGTYNQDDLVIVPITAAWHELTPAGSNPIDQVLIKTVSPQAAAGAANEATRTLLQLHSTTNPALADFTVLRQPQLVTAQVSTGTAVRRVLEVVAACLFVIGVALLTLLLRRDTRRGDRARDPLDVVVRALVVGLVGAAAGIVIAVAVAPVMQHLSSDMPAAQVSVYGVLAGAGIAVAAVAISLVVALAIGRTGGQGSRAEGLG